MFCKQSQTMIKQQPCYVKDVIINEVSTQEVALNNTEYTKEICKFITYTCLSYK